MGNTFLGDPAVAAAYGRGAACLRGTVRPGGVMTPLVRDRNASTAVSPSAGNAAQAAPQLTTFKNYQDKTRIAAAGSSVSGSHPAWDPV